MPREQTVLDRFIYKYKIKIPSIGNGDPTSRALMKELAIDKFIRENFVTPDMLDNSMIVGDRSKYFRGI